MTSDIGSVVPEPFVGDEEITIVQDYPARDYLTWAREGYFDPSVQIYMEAQPGTETEDSLKFVGVNKKGKEEIVNAARELFSKRQEVTHQNVLRVLAEKAKEM